MVSISYNGRERRLVLDGTCWPEDEPGIARAVREHAEPGRSLVLDLTRLSKVPAEVARAIVDARRLVELDGCWVSVWSVPGSTTAERLSVESGPAAVSAAV